jgi:hypothetical protein
MSVELIAIVVFALSVTIVFGAFIIRKIPKRLKVDKYTKKWKELQSYCKDKSKWPDALTEAEKLLEKALKKRKFKGKTMGEMMVSAQKVFTDNDGIWFAHNLYKKVNAGEVKSIKEDDIKDALIAYRQALRDLGALNK